MPWNPADLAGNITLANNNYTANSSGGNVNSGVRGTTSHNSGKYYLEFGCGGLFNPILASNQGAGLVNGSANLTLVGPNAIGIICYGSGAIWVNNSNVGRASPSGTVLDSSELDGAVDFTNSKVWFRVNINGGGTYTNWNNTAGANPATNTGGIDISGVTVPLFPVFVANWNTACQSAFKATLFIDPIPSGFTPWDSSPNISRAHSFIMG